MWLAAAAWIATTLAEPYAGQVDASSAHYDLEVAYAEAKTLSALQALEKQIDARMATAADDADLYWMKSRTMFEQGELFDRATGIDMVSH